MKRIDNLASCIHLACCPYFIILKIYNYLGSPNEICFAIDISAHLIRANKVLDMGNRTMQDLRYFPSRIKPILKLNHWMPKILLMRFLVSKDRDVISSLTSKDAHALVLPTISPIRDWLKSLSVHQRINFCMSCLSVMLIELFIICI